MRSLVHRFIYLILIVLSQLIINDIDFQVNNFTRAEEARHAEGRHAGMPLQYGFM